MQHDGSCGPAELRPGQQVEVRRMRDHQLVVRQLQLALGPLTRLRGLLGRPPLEPGQGMLLRPCRQVHCFFMRYAIDVVFLDAGGEVLHVQHGLRPYGVSVHQPRADCVLELPAGAAAQHGLRAGQRLTFCRLAPKV